MDKQTADIHQALENRLTQRERIKLLVTRREAADMLSVSLRTLDNLLKFNKELASRKIGSRRMVVFSSLLAFIRRDHPTQSEDRRAH